MHNENDDNWEISPDAVESLIAGDLSDLEVVDVREDWELTRGVLPNAVHLPLSKFQDHVAHWQPGRRYVIYCEHGVRSMDVVLWLAQNKSIAAKSMHGGFSVWKGPVAAPDSKLKP